MASEEQIKDLANAIWEQEGRPEGKQEECYFRAKQILAEQETAPRVEMPPHPIRRQSTKRACLMTVTTIVGFVVIILILHIVRILPLPPVTSSTPPSPPIYGSNP
jgi:LPS O-antigen subunit length determinant protein (WzzB/FepE family)